MPDCLHQSAEGVHCATTPPALPGLPPALESARSMRGQLAAFLHRLEQSEWPLLPLTAPNPWVSRGVGHFHLAAELFIQLGGWTDFEFPHTRLRLNPGEALLVPPRLLHQERIGASEDGTAFSNMVIYAESGGLRCHLACEAEPATPGIVHLELQFHPKAQRIHDWLLDASALCAASADTGESPAASTSPENTLAFRQARGLLTAAAAGALDVLDDHGPDSGTPAEPPLVSRVRVFVQNQLGDHQLSVRRLAEQARCTPDYLSNVFSVSAGEHLTAFINRQRIERATRLLRESRLTSKEIAWACGFTTQTYFIRAFRARTGATPKAWRAENVPLDA